MEHDPKTADWDYYLFDKSKNTMEISGLMRIQMKAHEGLPRVEKPSTSGGLAQLSSPVEESREPADLEIPANLDVPADLEIPADVENPADVETPADLEIPAEDEMEVTGTYGWDNYLNRSLNDHLEERPGCSSSIPERSLEKPEISAGDQSDNDYHQH